VWGLVIALFGVMRPDTFMTLNNFSSMFGSNAVLAMLALGLIIVLRVGDFDLSIAANSVVCGVVLGYLTAEHHVPLVLGIVLVVLVGAAIGALNAVIVLLLRVDSFITTLGMGTFLAGMALWFSNSATITGLPQSLVNWVVVYRLWGISLEFYYAFFLMIVLWYVFRYTAVGRRLLFVGKSREVSRLSGVHVSRLRFLAFVSAGVIAAAAGIIYAGTSGTADPTSGISFLLPAYAAAFLGATCIDIGDFNPIGTVVAVYFLVTGVTGLAIIGAPSSVQQIFYGAALIVSVTGSQYVARKKARGKLSVA
jgi:ribose transport system permease protein